MTMDEPRGCFVFALDVACRDFLAPPLLLPYESQTTGLLLLLLSGVERTLRQERREMSLEHPVFRVPPW